MSLSTRPVVVAAVTVLLAAPLGGPTHAEPAPSPAGLELTGVDPSVLPGDDFFRYGNGAWIDATEIPADRAGYGVSAIVSELTDRRTAELIQQVGTAQSTPGSEARKIADYYASFIDEAAIEAGGLRPLQPMLDRIAAITDLRSLSRQLGASLRADVDAFNATDLYTPHLFGLWVAQDLDQPTRYAAFLLQGGLDLPDRAYYLDTAPRMAAIRDQHRAHIATVLRLANIAGADSRAARILELERQISQVQVSREDSHGAEKGNNPWPRQRFDRARRGSIGPSSSPPPVWGRSRTSWSGSRAR